MRKLIKQNIVVYYINLIINMIKYITSILSSKNANSQTYRWLVGIALIYATVAISNKSNAKFIKNEGFHQTKPYVYKKDDDIYDEFYADIYDELMNTSARSEWELVQMIRITSPDTNNSVFLDIGSGIGEVTDVFREEGWLSHAVEMNSVAIDWLNGRNHEEVFHGTLDAYETDLKFDIIMAWGVVEHVLDPNGFLQQVKNLLLPQGVFVSEVPHGECFLIDMSRKTGVDPKRILMGEQHIVLYSTQAYIDLHERNGFELIHLQTNGLDISTTFKELGLNIEDDLLSSMQECIDEKLYGDLLRGFWRKA